MACARINPTIWFPSFSEAREADYEKKKKKKERDGEKERKETKEPRARGGKTTLRGRGKKVIPRVSRTSTDFNLHTLGASLRAGFALVEFF